jgi:diguanylate cyclase (GGDEF)-like protein
LDYNGRVPLIINDTSKEEVFHVFLDHNIGSYLGVPVTYQNGEVFGTLCAVDTKPSHFTNKEAEHLLKLSRFFSYVLTLEKQAVIDTLTGLYNRRYLYQYLSNKELIGSRKLTIMFIDLDGFKVVNDTYGHDYGDRILKKVGRRLIEVVPNIGFVARLGGDEFIMVFNDLHEYEQISTKAQEILHVLSNWEGNEEGILLTASIGIVNFPDDSNSVDTLIKHADQAMYVAKHQGKNQFIFYSHL